FQVGADVLHLERSFDTGLVAVYPDRAALDAYTIHPLHQEAANFGRHIAEQVVSMILFLSLALVLAQIPFVYRRYETGKLAEKISNLEARRQIFPNPKFNEYKGVVHVHSSLGGHSTGTFAELAGGARENNLDFVVMTEHTSELFDASAMTLQGAVGGVLFVNGNEANTKGDE
ncbi:hypothetical protein PTTG_31146, partial [Puccinia triticina 1-1 BBBD Race 1]